MTVVNPKSISGINSITTGSGSDDLLTIHNNNGAERFRVDGSGNTRITSGIVTTLSVGAVTGDINIDDRILHTGDTNTMIRFPANDTVSVETAGVQRFTVDAAGRVLVGGTAEYTAYSDSKIQVATNDSTAAVQVTRWSADGSSPYINLGKSRGAVGAYTIVQSGDRLGQINFVGTDGTDMASHAASIAAYVDGTPGSNDMPGRIVFATSADGGISETERLRINSSGKVGINSTAPDGMLAIEHTSSAPNLTMRNHPAAGPYTNEYGLELRHAYGSVKHGALIHTQEAADGRRSLDVSDSNGIFATFANHKVGINTYTPNHMLHLNGLNGSALIRMDDNGVANRWGKIFNYAEGIHLQARNNTAKGNIVFRGEDGSGTTYYGRFTENGLCFNSDTAAVNALDDYEEGQWTPIIQFSSGGDTATYGGNTGGWYTKVGRLVTCNGRIQITAKGGGSSAVYFGGLPFTVGNNNSGTSGIEGGLTFAYAGNCNADKGSGWIGGYANESSTYAVPFYVDTSNNFHYVEDFDIDSDFSVGFVITYTV